MFFEKMPAFLNNAIKKFVKEEEGEKEIVKIPFKDDLIQNGVLTIDEFYIPHEEWRNGKKGKHVIVKSIKCSYKGKDYGIWKKKMKEECTYYQSTTAGMLPYTKYNDVKEIPELRQLYEDVIEEFDNKYGKKKPKRKQEIELSVFD